MAATIAALAAAFVMTRRLPIAPLVTGAVVLVFGGLTLVFADETFIKMKPTLVNALLSLVLFGGLLFRQAFVKPLFELAFQLDAAGWRALSFRWACFFAAMAVLNEVVWRSVSTDAWVGFKVFGYLPLTLAFGIAQVPLIRRHSLAADAQS
jgi:intracellular septation protein